MSFLPTQNYSLFALPVCYILSLYPHAYAVNLIKSATNGQWDNSNPRSTQWDETMKRIVPKETYASFERAEAAHKNGMENFPLFATALVIGTVVQLPNQSMNAFAGMYLLVRALYTAAYINIKRGKISFVRSALWGLGMGLCISIIGMAANKVRLSD
ncbi:uncharacterized protein V1513DRAFT_455756 [Lipomyces chichibuensis]|uniref:uncharacterized protein n=1 Tax=Lipomyces chichibuensis TaxID=1546026 RepID=UPI0033441CB5